MSQFLLFPAFFGLQLLFNSFEYFYVYVAPTTKANALCYLLGIKSYSDSDSHITDHKLTVCHLKKVILEDPLCYAVCIALKKCVVSAIVNYFEYPPTHTVHLTNQRPKYNTNIVSRNQIFHIYNVRGTIMAVNIDK